MCVFNSKCIIVYTLHVGLYVQVCARLATCTYYNYASLSKLAWVCCRYEYVCAKWYHPVRHVCDCRTQGVLFRSDLPGTSKHPPQRASHTQHSMACQHHLTRRFIFSAGHMRARMRVLMCPCVEFCLYPAASVSLRSGCPRMIQARSAAIPGARRGLMCRQACCDVTA